MMTSSEQDTVKKNVYQRPLVRPPTMKEIAAEAEELGISASERELEQYHVLARESAEVYQTWANIPEDIPPVRYPRTPGYRPAPEDNPNNAWFWKTDIQGAPKGKLLGKSVAIKDNIPVAGVPMRNGSFQLEGYTADFDATVITRILDAGGRIAGKAAVEDFCFSASSVSPQTGTVTNPVNPLYSAGGSSCGSAALVASGEVDMALGGDQAGSIRMPGAWCGIVGMKPTHSLVPYTGIIPIEQSIDHVGPMTRTVEDCALLLEVLAGYDDGLDPRQSENVSSQKYTNMLSKDLTGMRVGVVKEGFPGMEPDVDAMVREAAYKLQEAGALVEDISIPLHTVGRGLLVALMSEGSFRTIYREDGFGHGWQGFYPTSIVDTLRKSKVDVDKQASTVKASWIFQSYLTKNYGLHFYAKAMNIRRKVRKAYEEVLKKYDVLVMPTMPHKPYKLLTQEAGENVYEFQHHCWDMIINTPQFDVTGNPALTINAGYSAEGLPIGMQIVGRHFEDGTVLKVAYAFECIRDGK